MSGPRRGRLLLLSPVVPALAGNGLAMRAGVALEALSETFDVTLLVVPIVAGADGALDPTLAARCARVVIHRPAAVDPLFDLVARVKDPIAGHEARIRYPRPALCRFATTAAIRAAAETVAELAFDVVHVVRLYTLPFAGPLLGADRGASPRLWLDLDDHECATWMHLADALAARGHARDAEVGRAEATKYAAMEREWLPRCDRVWVASPADVASVSREHPGTNVQVLVNVVRIPEADAPASSSAASSRAPTLLFVGSLGYWPNEDAVRFLCGEILPRLRRLVRSTVRVHLVGTRPPPAVRALARDPDVTLSVDVPDIADAYREADVVVVPIRTGGGTRIKLLEAFAHRRPVVATRAGADGIAARDGEHLLLADSADDLAAACARLLREREVARGLVERAATLAAEQHALARVRDVLRRAWAGSGVTPRDT